jgi:hypothetical protein
MDHRGDIILYPSIIASGNLLLGKGLLRVRQGDADIVDATESKTGGEGLARSVDRPFAVNSRKRNCGVLFRNPFRTPSSDGVNRANN